MAHLAIDTVSQIREVEMAFDVTEHVCQSLKSFEQSYIADLTM